MQIENKQRRNILTAGLATVCALGIGLAGNTFAASAAATGASSSGVALSAAARGANKRFFPGFSQRFIKTSGATINTLVGGEGPPLLLIHGHPATHMEWHKVATQLAQKYTVVLVDLRGYGDSSKPDGGVNHVNYSKKNMGLDLVEVMKTLGHDTFQAVGHDRGGRVLHAMMMYYPETIERAVTLDIAPADEMYAHTDESFATKYFWWFFHIQAAPLPERMVGAEPELYLRAHLDVQSKTPGAVTPEAFAEYFRCYAHPDCIHAVCEDYRATVTIDREHVTSFNGKATPPLLALWGGKGTVGQTFDVLALWRNEVENVTGFALPSGHLIPEEVPGPLLDALNGYLVA
ncbi:alpha/beta fold hydrolase [Caballeronia sordidicola]|uniref:Alpha/beta hydrolase protein n=1 Tax=Caballeronia sordidicola TaxID=196367 RepID=A0A242MXU4_CABSO|nr:alpha/beta hydrolase [Caballeronia sordidicola]OTP76143.1 Alpha/beta hydrolase protein [Caballeronia sordidicola]